MSDFSIVIPVYDSEETIIRALDSCLSQSLLPMEIIIIDDCSMDKSSILVKKWQDAYSGDVSIVYKKLEHNSGPSRARNTGWDIAKGEYVCFLDADDYFMHNKLERVDALLRGQEEIVLLAHDHRTKEVQENKGKSQPAKMRSREILLKNRFATPSVTILRSIPERFDETMRYTEDHDLWLRVTMQYDQSYYLAEMLTIIDRTVNSSGGQSGNLWQMRKGEIGMYRKYCLKHGKIVQFPVWLAFSLLKHSIKLLKG